MRLPSLHYFMHLLKKAADNNGALDGVALLAPHVYVKSLKLSISVDRNLAFPEYLIHDPTYLRVSGRVLPLVLYLILETSLRRGRGFI